MASGTIKRDLGSFGFPVARTILRESAGGDLNDILETGIYTWGYAPANAPYGASGNIYNNGWLICLRRGVDSAKTVIQYSTDSANVECIRCRYTSDSGATWTDWKVVPSLQYRTIWQPASGELPLEIPTSGTTDLTLTYPNGVTKKTDYRDITLLFLASTSTGSSRSIVTLPANLIGSYTISVPISRGTVVGAISVSSSSDTNIRLSSNTISNLYLYRIYGR